MSKVTKLQLIKQYGKSSAAKKFIAELLRGNLSAHICYLDHMISKFVFMPMF